MSFQSISRVTLVCWAVTSSGPNAEYIYIAQNVQDYIGGDELKESCLCLMSDADESGVRVLTLVPTDRDIGLGDLGLPEVPGVLRGPFLDRFLFVVEPCSSCLAIQCPSGFLLCYWGLSLRFPLLHMVMRA